MTTVHDSLSDLTHNAINPRNKGDKFESFTRQHFETTPKYRDLFDDFPQAESWCKTTILHVSNGETAREWIAECRLMFGKRCDEKFLNLQFSAKEEEQ